jgi:hypothetical protein
VRASSRSTPSNRRISVSAARAVSPIAASRCAPLGDRSGVVIRAASGQRPGRRATLRELQDAATHLVVAGRGRLVADTSVAELIAAASAGRMTLRTGAQGARGEAMRALADAGATVAATGPETLTVTGLGPERIAELLGRHSVAFSEVGLHRSSLEEAYMELTRDAVEFRAAEAKSV